MCSQLSSIQYGLCWQCLAHVWMGNGAEAWNAGFYCLKYWVPILHTLTFKVEDHALNCFQFYKFVSIITMELSLKFLVCSTNCFNLCLQARMGFVAEIIRAALMYNVWLIFSLFLLSPVSTFTMWKKTAGNQSVLEIKPLGAGSFMSEKMDLYADKESAPKQSKERGRGRTKSTEWVLAPKY